MEAKKAEGIVAGMFITLEEKWWTPEMRRIARQAGKFKHPQSVTQYPSLQHWHIKQHDDKLQDGDAMWAGLPILPELANLLSGKERIIEQPTFWHRT